jgi:hypothetical protein
MPFFQNPFDQEFRGSVPFGDRQYSLTFAVPPNRNQNQAMIAWNTEPYDFSTYNSFSINFAIDTKDFKNYATISVNVAGASPSATKASEVVTLLNADPVFSAWFSASVVEASKNPTTGYSVYRVGIKTINTGRQNTRVYITNSGAEQILRFNKYAGVAELPTYYARHTIANRFDYPDGVAALVQLDESDSVVDQPIITDAGFDYAAMQADWQLLGGRVGIFTFQNNTVDSNGRITQTIEYPAGAKAGDIARLIQYTYTSTHTNPDQVTQIPYTLTSGDLVTP